MHNAGAAELFELYDAQLHARLSAMYYSYFLAMPFHNMMFSIYAIVNKVLRGDRYAREINVGFIIFVNAKMLISRHLLMRHG